jgi:hypothetical protein
MKNTLLFTHHTEGILYEVSLSGSPSSLPRYFVVDTFSQILEKVNPENIVAITKLGYVEDARAEDTKRAGS